MRIFELKSFSRFTKQSHKTVTKHGLQNSEVTWTLFFNTILNTRVVNAQLLSIFKWRHYSVKWRHRNYRWLHRRLFCIICKHKNFTDQEKILKTYKNRQKFEKFDEKSTIQMTSRKNEQFLERKLQFLLFKSWRLHQ